MSGDRRIYKCPGCGQEHSGVPSGYEDGGGDDGEQLTAIFDCDDCGRTFAEDEGFWGFESAADEEAAPG
jgi:DNA-directed RNA polymerase subunit RPC12/RpoP